MIDLGQFLAANPPRPIVMRCAAERPKPDLILAGKDCLLVASHRETHGLWKACPEGYRRIEG